MGDAFDAFHLAFEQSKKVGDDSRSALLAANICLVQSIRGLYADAIAFGNKAIALGEASSSSVLLISYTNLIDAYVLAGQEAKAIECMELARRWLVPRRRWKFHCGFLMECAAFELIRGNTALALELIGQLETVARDREDAVPMHGSYWKLRVFREASLGRLEEAERLVCLKQVTFQETCPLYFLDILAAKTWLQRRTLGQITAETERELAIFDQVGAAGKKAILTAQGFLPYRTGAPQYSGRAASEPQVRSN
jgi:tetratricopeptide (TPR) repeat protein